MQSALAQLTLKKVMLLGLIAVLAGCGQKGALYLPESEQAVPEIVPGTATADIAPPTATATAEPASQDEEGAESKDKEPPAP